MSRNYLLPGERTALSRDGDGNLLLRLDGQTVRLKLVQRTLPLSDPGRYIVLNDQDGNEVGVLRDMDELDEASREVLEEALQQTYQIQTITRILEVEKEPLSGHTRWRVELALDGQAPDLEAGEEPEEPRAKGGLLDKMTRRRRRNDDQNGYGDDGFNSLFASILAREREFFISGQEDVQTARYPHIYIVDTEGNRYQVEDCEALDLGSRHAAERFF